MGFSFVPRRWFSDSNKSDLIGLASHLGETTLEKRFFFHLKSFRCVNIHLWKLPFKQSDRILNTSFAPPQIQFYAFAEEAFSVFVTHHGFYVSVYLRNVGRLAETIFTPDRISDNNQTLNFLITFSIPSQFFSLLILSIHFIYFYQIPFKLNMKVDCEKLNGNLTFFLYFSFFIFLGLRENFHDFPFP